MRLFGSVYLRLNKDTTNLSIIFQNVVIRFNALDEVIDLRTEYSDWANFIVLLFGGVVVSVDLFNFILVMKDDREYEHEG